MTNKEFKRVEKNLSKATQEAYIKVLMEKYNEELSHVITEEEMVSFKARWSTIADKLSEGWILDVESV